MTAHIFTKSTVVWVRNLFKRLNMHDADYRSIKRDLPIVRQRLSEMDLAHDVAGTFVERALFGMRLLSYGESDEALSIEDADTLFSPMLEWRELTMGTFGNREGGSAFVKLSVDLLQSIFSEPDVNINDANELRTQLRVAFAYVSGLAKDLIGYALLLDFCLVRYGMVDLRDKYAERFEKVVLSSENADAVALFNRGRDAFGETEMNLGIHPFAVPLTSSLVSCAEGEFDYRVLANVFSDLRGDIALRRNGKELLTLMEDSPAFEEMGGVLCKHYGVGEGSEHDD